MKRRNERKKGTIYEAKGTKRIKRKKGMERLTYLERGNEKEECKGKKGRLESKTER